MPPLFHILLALSLTAIVVTVYAFLTAPDGIQDEEGFHAVLKEDAPESQVPDHARDGDQHVPPFVSAH